MSESIASWNSFRGVVVLFSVFFLGGEGLLLTGWLVHRNPPKSPNVDRETSHEKIVGVVRFAHLTRW